jgi:hypothetical protein
MTYTASMDYGIVSHGYSIAYMAGAAGGAMNHGPILYIGAGTDGDLRLVSSDHGIIPYGAFIPHGDISDHYRSLACPGIAQQLCFLYIRHVCGFLLKSGPRDPVFIAIIPLIAIIVTI